MKKIGLSVFLFVLFQILREEIKAKRGHGLTYLFPHNYNVPGFASWVKQQYLPDEIKDKEFYVPKDAGREKN